MCMHAFIFFCFRACHIFMLDTLRRMILNSLLIFQDPSIDPMELKNDNESPYIIMIYSSGTKTSKYYIMFEKFWFNVSKIFTLIDIVICNCIYQ